MFTVFTLAAQEDYSAALSYLIITHYLKYVLLFRVSLSYTTAISDIGLSRE